jgi:4-amino-4-deoxy-L-arabinose transferase-like glycosyltransferase
MISDTAINFLTGAGVGGAFQVASEVFKLGGKGLQMFGQLAAARDERAMEVLKLENDAANQAAKRFPGWLSGSLALIAFFSFFVLSYTNGWFGVNTTVQYMKEPFLNLFGLLRLGGGPGFKEVSGFVLPPEMGQAVMMIAGGVFGIKAVKTR